MAIKSGQYEMPGRMISLPESVSPQARAFLQSRIGADGKPVPPSPSPDPDDIDGWRTARQTVNAYMDGLSEMMEPHLKSPVECIRIDGVDTYVATPDGAPDDRAYLDLHGGGLVYGDGLFCRTGARNVADRHGIRCYAPDYPMPPDHPYPAALDSCVATYRYLLGRYDPKRIVIGGASAGGNLAAATVLRARDEGLPLPAGIVLLTPELDLTESGDTFETNQLHDLVLPRPLMNANLLYANGADLSHPYLSPLFGDFTAGFPPVFLQSGTRDLFLSNTVRMHRALLRAGVHVELHIFEGMPHGGFGGAAPEDLELAAETIRFVRACLSGAA